MSERLLSVGLDVGTTSTQMILSELKVENRAGSFSVPEMEIAQRKILYKGAVHFTPLLHGELVDTGALRKLVEAEYAAAGVRREDVDTGAIIITGETSRKENARAVLQELSGFAGDFVVATAGPHLESVLAAKGAGAVDFSQRTGKNVLHMDIGGGTSNLAWIRDGKIVNTGCLNVGGRLLKLDENGKITYVSPVLHGICELKVGDIPGEAQLRHIADTLVSTLEMAAGLRTETELLAHLTTKESVIASQSADWRGNPADGNWVISFSGGVADCIDTRHNTLAFGDIGPVLGHAIRESRLCGREYVLGSETIRATVIGAGCHSAQLSGSTVFCRNVTLPLKNLQTLPVPEELQESAALSGWIRSALSRQDGRTVLALKGFPSPSYPQVTALAQAIAGAVEGDILLCVEQDMAKALGQAIAAHVGSGRAILCIDRVKLGDESYLDVGAPVGPALPVVVKTLVLER